MATKLDPNHNAEEFYVEVIGADGLSHHVGPFDGRRQAEDWITKNAATKPPIGARDWVLSQARLPLT